MKRTGIIWTVVIIIVIVVIWIVVANMNSQSPTSVTTSVTTVPVQQAVTILTLNSAVSPTLGTYLVAANGMTLYVSNKDTTGVSNCSGQCATAWPPYVTTTTMGLQGGTSVTGNISTIPRADGPNQVTYNGMPLYFWQGDKGVGDTTGQAVNGFSVAKP